MEATTILLINVSLILFISFCSDHWIMLKIKSIPPHSSCNLIKLRQMSILQCPKNSYVLVEQHANLYRQCNDLTDGYRMNASRSNQLYSTTCYWFLADPSGIWRVFQTDWGIDIFSLHCAVAAIISKLAAFYQCQHNHPQNVSRILTASLSLFSIPIIISIYIIHSTNIRQANNEAEEMYYSEAGWSLICAIVSVILSCITAYLYTARSRFIRERQRSQRRRRQIHKAIMSSCRQDIAMAIRAKMTVI